MDARIPLVVGLFLLTAGCLAENGMRAATTLATPDGGPITCSPGQYLTGISASGAPVCAMPFAGFQCPPEEYMYGVGTDGRPVCAQPVARAPTTWAPDEATVEVTPALRVINVYGVRPDTQSNIETLKVYVDLAAGAQPTDLARLVVRYSTPSNSMTYAWSPTPASNVFTTSWIRGNDASGVMRPGDLVEIAFWTPEPLATRTAVAMSLIPEIGEAASGDFKTPPTYGTDTIITLR